MGHVASQSVICDKIRGLPKNKIRFRSYETISVKKPIAFASQPEPHSTILCAPKYSVGTSYSSVEVQIDLCP